MEHGLHNMQSPQNIPDSILVREKLLLYILLDENYNSKIKDIIDENTFKSEKNKEIVTILYEEFRKGNSNNKNLLDLFKNEEDLSYLTGILAEDFNITDIDKTIVDITNGIKRDMLENNKQMILHKLKDSNLTKDEIEKLEKDLSNIIIDLAKFK